MLFGKVKKRRCAICWGPVVQRWTGKRLEIACPRGCMPGGHVSENFVERRRAEDMINAVKVEAAYPNLIERVPMTSDEINASASALWRDKPCQ